MPRKVPFSAKQKRAQLQAKKQRKGGTGFSDETRHEKHAKKKSVLSSDEEDDGDTATTAINAINKQPVGGGSKSNPNRYVLQFHKETAAELKERKERAYQTLEPVDQKDLEHNLDEYFLPELDFPKRPEWNFNMSPEQLDRREQEYFRDYLSSIEKHFDWKDLSYFELNLETWRQLWRVMEISDIILIIIDVRYPCLMFPPALYEYVTRKLGKDMILVMNKVDLAPAPLVLAWKEYFQTKFPKLSILCFTSYPTYNLRNNIEKPNKGLQVRRRRGKMKMAAEGAQKLVEACTNIVGGAVDLSSWETKIKEEMHLEYEDVDDEDDRVEVGETIELKKQDTQYEVHEKYKSGVLTIGCVGQPNVGKSSLMNAIMGRKVVSVSRTPGHTKHFQTIFLTDNVRLCDCPGLVFPSKVPKPLQVLMGSYPVAQLREPYSTVQYLAERMDLIKLLHIKHPSDDEYWCSMDICDGWAQKRGYMTAKSGRHDSYRAANELLRMATEGRICLCLMPPQYLDRQGKVLCRGQDLTVSDLTAVLGQTRLLDQTSRRGRNSLDSSA
uniref:Guanine nucleotide-binding protein-like 1 n=1 Tax=Cacopsylla melanoneura TaxID=428564 RepID=A0A8D8XEB5_9HEMI